MKRILFVFSVMLVMRVATFAQSVNITFAWDASSDAGNFPATNPVKYRLNVSATAPPYATLPADRQIVEADTALEAVRPFTRGSYFVFATAYACAVVSDGICQGTEIAESGASNVLKIDVSIPPGKPGNYRIRQTQLAESTSGQTMQMARTRK